MRHTKLRMWNGSLSFIPCAITLCNALCGLAAIIYMMDSMREIPVVPMLAIWLIFSAMVFDVFDGYAARKLHAESVHGMQLDSLSDLISFGIAPAVLVHAMAVGLSGNGLPGMWIAWSASGFYAVCAIWRLATYNTLALEDSPSKPAFSGLPSPAAALAICSAMMLLDRLEPDPMPMAIVAVAYAFFSGFLMVSGFEYLHFKKIAKSGPLAVRVMLLTLVVVALFRFGSFAFFALVHLYVLSGPLAEIIEKRNEWVENTIRKL
jgi:CDP-diacylglycerol--serine O-phosphatidyltransferase